MVKLAPYGLAVAVVASNLVLVGLGAAVTSSPATASFRIAHQVGAVVVSCLTLALAVWLFRAKPWLSGTIIGFVSLLAVPVGELASFRIWHACLAQGLFVSTWSAMVILSPRWSEGPSIVQDGGFPSLRSLSLVAAVVTALQVVLGAAFRHGAMGVIPHIVGAMVTTVIILILSTFTITQFPKHRALVGAAWHLIGVVTLQIGLGVIAFVGRLNQPEGVVPSGGLVASTVAHVVMGALVFAGAMALALQIQYHVRPRAAVESGLSVAS
jgi:hypothetical protein